jgi:predicted DNA-binding transcriptional regulator YafY
MLEERARTLDELAAAVGDGGVTTRTIRRDFEALERAGFPIFNERDDDRVTRWRLLKCRIPQRAA